MKHHFRLLLSLTAILALGSLAACSGKPTTPPSAHNRVTLTFWHGMTGASQQTLNGLVRGFNQSQSKYTVVASGQGDFANVQQKIMAAAKSDTLPTIAQTTYTNVPDYVHGQFIVPLNTYLPKHTMARIDPNLRQVSYYRGQTYAMPFSKSIGLLFYNRDLLKQTHTAVPKSWEALQRDATRVKAQGLTGLALNQNFAAEWDTLAFQAGTPLMTPRPKLTSPKMLAATHVVYDMLKAKTATTAGTDGYGNVQFFKGKTLFYSGSSAAIGVL
nr:extracellular solute-binding protein [Levilactobacillus wangkuiensis]